MKKTHFLGVIPARGGSKGIPRKNIKKIAGKPLIAWSIEAARRSRMIDRLVVSTEDAEIAEISLQYGAEVLERPVDLASDTATTLSVLQHVLTCIETEAVVLLQPTSPVRGEKLIDRCIRTFKSARVDNLATGFMCKFREYTGDTTRRQDYQGFFYDDGNVYVIKAEVIKNGRMFGKKAGRVFSSRAESVEIDDDFDFWLAEQLLKRGMR